MDRTSAGTLNAHVSKIRYDILPPVESLRLSLHDISRSLFLASMIRYDTIRYDMIRYFNVRSKGDIRQLNLPHGTNN